MSNVIKSDYVIVKQMDYDEFLQWEDRFSYSSVFYETDVFNKSSRTTVCFSGAYGSRVMYCENCDETHCNHMAMEVELREYSNDDEKYEDDFIFANRKSQAHISKVICKKCGSVYNLEDVRIIKHARYAHESDVRLVYDTIYNDNDLVKYSIKTCSMVVERAFYSVDNQYKIIFNTKTGQTYLYNNPMNKKQKIKLIPSKLTLENINFAARNFNYVFHRSLVNSENQKEYKINKVKEIYNLIYEKISNNLGYKPKTLEQYAKEFNLVDEWDIYSFEVLAIFNRFPNMNPFGVIAISEDYDFKYVPLKKLKAIKNTSKNPLLELCNAYKVKDFDLFKKYFYSSMSEKIYWLIYFSMFLDNKDYLEKILDKYRQYSGIASSSRQVDRLVKNRYTLDNAITLLFKDIRQSMNEDNMYLLIDKYISSYEVSDKIDGIANLYYVMKKKTNCKVKFDMQYVCNLLCGVLNDRDVKKVLETIENYMYKELNKTIYNKNKKRFKFKLNTIDEYKNSIEYGEINNNILISSIYSFIPHFNPYVLAQMLFGHKLTHSAKNQYDILEGFNIKDYIKDDKCDILGELFKEFNIPNVKSLRNKILKNPKLFASLAFYGHIFTDVNMLNKILDSIKDKNNFYFDLSEIKKYLFTEVEDDYRNHRLEYIHKLAECLVLAQGETIAAKKIASVYSSGNLLYLEDIWPMYEIHLELYPNEPVDITGNIKEIHDRLVGLTGGANKPFTEADFKAFKYSKTQKGLNTDIDGYSFRLVHNGRELAILGNDLKNCVRGYVNRVRAKDSFIVAVTYNNEYKICIELRPIDKKKCSNEDSLYEYELYQAKLYANLCVSKDEEALRVVLEWMNMNNIKDGSSDLNTSFNSVLSRHHQVEIVQEVPIQANLAREIETFEEYEEDAIPF